MALPVPTHRVRTKTCFPAGAGIGEFPGPDEPEDGPEEEEAFEPVGVVELPFVELLPDKSAKSTLKALMRIEAALCEKGIYVARLHSDAGAEFTAEIIADWAASRGIAKSHTGGDDW